MHQEPFMEGGLPVGSLAIIPFAEFATCVTVTCFNVDFFPLICRKTDHCQSCSSCKLPYYVPSSNVIVEAITAVHVLNTIFFYNISRCQWPKYVSFTDCKYL